MSEETIRRYACADLEQFATGAMQAVGLAEERARAVADILVAADLFGHATHGLALLPWYLKAVQSGAIRVDGAPEVLVDRGACITWNGQRLPGAWLATRALDTALERVATYGTVTLVIREGSHVGALVPYVERATRHGYMAIMASSTPSVAGVAPFGSAEPVFTPNPIAVGLPTREDPILIDISASITTLNRARQLERQGQRFPSPWVIDAEGQPSDRPDVVTRHGGALLPVGGIDHGHKGYGLALMVEGLTQGLSGFGRADHPDKLSVSLFLQVLDPDAFGTGRDAFERQTQFLAESCRTARPMTADQPVRVPGDRACAHKRDALAHGVPLAESITESIEPWLEPLALAFPPPLDV